MIIIDASVATKLINIQEEGSSKAAELLSAHVKGQEKITVPQLLFLEVANALATKSQIQETQIEEGIGLLYEAKFKVSDIQKSDVVDAALFAKRYKTSVYDMLYVILAKKNNCILITADEKFATKVNLPFLKSLFTIK